MIDLHGVFTALVTPFSPDGASVDWQRLAANIERQAIAGVRGVVPCGTTGETPTLSAHEYRGVVDRTIAHAATRDLIVIAGAGSNSTSHAVELHRHVHASGAHAALHVTPYYNKPSSKGVERHFLTIADACDLPVMLYHVPGRTGVRMSFETIHRLALHPNIQAIKEASGDVTLAARLARETDLAVLSGDDPLTLPLLATGAVGVVSVVANLYPDRVAALVAAWMDGHIDAASDISSELAPLSEALLTLDTNPVPVKTALSMLGFDTGAVRLPLCPSDAAVRERLDTLLASAPTTHVVTH